MTVLVLAVLAGLLQAAGYTIYIRKSLKHEVEPNPLTWLMFAYGTALLTVLEWDKEAPLPLLILPVVCAVLSIFVAGLCAVRGKLRWPKDAPSKLAFQADIVLTLAYGTVWYLSGQDYLNEEGRSLLVTGFLLLTNASTIVSFVPLVSSTIRDPQSEHPFPWAIWTLAYTTLGVATWLEMEANPLLLIYPVSCAILHGLVCLLALRRR